ncbi:hypothetical protein VPHD81_0109 [Vibrio phage D81]
MNNKDLLTQFDELFIARCEKLGMNRPDTVAALLEDRTRKSMLDAMVHAESRKTQVVMTVRPGHPILEQMFINQSKPTEGV